jgi:hypothetical protein
MSNRLLPKGHLAPSAKQRADSKLGMKYVLSVAASKGVKHQSVTEIYSSEHRSAAPPRMPI